MDFNHNLQKFRDLSIIIGERIYTFINLPKMRPLKSRRESTEGNEVRCPTFRMSQFLQSQSEKGHTSRLPFADRRNRVLQQPSKVTLKISTKRTLGQSTRMLRNPSAAMLNLSRAARMQTLDFAFIINSQVRRSKIKNDQHQSLQILRSIFKLSEDMNEEVYSYKIVQQKMQKLNETVKTLGSNTLIYRTFALSGFCFFQYGSYSLSLYYFDRAFKSFYDREDNYHSFQKNLQLQLYKSVSRIFLVKARYQQAKNFAFKLLRKSWIAGDIDEQISAYDLLGKIFMQMQEISMSRYFHHRMSSGDKESAEILAMSKQEMGKQQRQKLQFVCYETINIFVEGDEAFNDILENHYRMRSLEHAQQMGKSDFQQVYIYTHHSPNRLLNNYHVLQRKLIQARNSREIHFIRPRDCHRLRKLISQYSAIIHDIMHRMQGGFLQAQSTTTIFG